MSASQYQFSRAFDRISNVVEFNEEWNNGTGYMDNLVHSGPKLSAGEQVKCTTPNNRRVIITGSPVGNIAVFERYSAVDKIDQGTERSSVIVYNAPDPLRGLLGGTSLDEGQVMLALGTPGNDNLGAMVKRIVDTATKLSKFYGE